MKNSMILSALQIMEVSPMHPSNLFPNAYWLNFSGFSGEHPNFVKRTGKVWKVFDIGGIII